MRVALVGPAVVLLLSAMPIGCSPDMSETVGRSSHRGDLWLPPDTELVPGHVPAHATLDRLLRTARVRPDQITAIVDAVRRVFDPRRLRPGQSWRYERTLTG